MNIQDTQTFSKLEKLQKKIYSSKIQSDKIYHLVELSKNRGVQFMKDTQHPNTIQLGIVKDLLNV